MKVSELGLKANRARGQILEMIVGAGKGHIGGAFSCVDILVTLYLGGVLRFDPARPDWDERDRFLLSKGHACTALYSVLAAAGFFPVQELSRYGQNGCLLGGHPDRRIPGVEADTGSLGNGVGIGVGLALGAQMDGKNWLTVVLVGDGECYEGSNWEAAMFAAHHRLHNLMVLVDRNGLCATDFTKDCVGQDSLEEKWRSFGWDTAEVDGHSFSELLQVLGKIRTRNSPRPLAIICKTIKGKGVSFMEGRPEWHHSVPKGEQLALAKRDLGLQP